MNSVGLNVFIAIVGLSSGPKFIAGLQQLGFGLFLWGIVATTLPIIAGMFVGKYLFRFDDAILLGAVSGRAHHDRVSRHGERCRQEPDPQPWLHGHLRGREHAADDLGHGARHADDLAGIRITAPRHS